MRLTSTQPTVFNNVIQAAQRFSGALTGNRPVRLQQAEEILPIAEDTFNDRPYKIAIGGYLDQPEGYNRNRVGNFLRQLIRKLRPEKVGLITSPTTLPESIDVLTTEISQKMNVPVCYMTSERYANKINPDQLPENVSVAKFLEQPKHIFPNNPEYAWATILGSSVLIPTGGRAATVTDWVKAVQTGDHAIVLLDNKNIKDPAWDPMAQKPLNGVRYILEQSRAFLNGEPLPHPEYEGFTRNFLETHREIIESQVTSVPLSDDAQVAFSAERASQFIRKKVGATRPETMAMAV